jgi:hypothetical protein
MNKHLDAFIARNSLVNARKLVAFVNRNPSFLDMLSEDHAGLVREAERMVESEGRHQAMDVFKNGFHPDDAASMQRWLARKGA